MVWDPCRLIVLGLKVGPKGAVRQLKRYASWIYNVRQFGPIRRGRRILARSCSVVREDPGWTAAGVPVVVPMASPGSYVRNGEPLKASKREADPQIRNPEP